MEAYKSKGITRKSNKDNIVMSNATWILRHKEQLFFHKKSSQQEFCTQCEAKNYWNNSKLFLEIN